VKTCRTGGECKIGDIGPGGGVIFYVASQWSSTPQSWGRYLEAAPNGWTGTTSDYFRQFGCRNQVISGAQGVAIGSGKRNTEAIVSACPTERNIAAQVANDLILNNKDDWFLPSRDELDAMYVHREGVGITTMRTLSQSDCLPYASSTTQSSDYFHGQTFKDCVITNSDGRTFSYQGRQQFSTVPRNYSYAVRPIRYVE